MKMDTTMEPTFTASEVNATNPSDSNGVSFRERAALDSWLLAYDFTEHAHREHLWGYEQWIVNNAFYCAKLITLTNPNVRSSVHCHRGKFETFICVQGEVHLFMGTDEHGWGMLNNPTTMIPGCVYSIPRGTFHSFWGEGVILEVSTPDTDDNVKVRPASEISNNFDASLGGGK
jgi:mannose-6-phosphate isomerase-like protein (cupin superfamily)